MTPKDKGQEHPIPDVGNLNHVKEGDLIIWLATQKVARDVYDFFEYANEQMQKAPDSEKEMVETFKRAYSFIHKRFRYPYEDDHGTE